MSTDDRKRLLLATAFFIFAVALAALRVGFSIHAGGMRISAVYVMHDFFATAYYPVRAFLEGKSPYSVVYPPFAPTHLLFHLPFGLLSTRAAGIAYFLFTALLAIPLALLTLRLVNLKSDPARALALAGAILLSRPGHWTLLVGQLSILLSLFAYATLLFSRSRPVLAGWALSATMFKPTWGVPLALLLWGWGRRKAATSGLGLAALLNLPLVALLASREGGLQQLVTAALSSYRGFEDVVDPLTHKGRTDLTTLMSRLVGAPLSSLEQVLVSAVVLLISIAVLRRLARHTAYPANALGFGILCLATSLVGYHQGYDLVLLTAPCLAAALPSSSSWIKRPLRLAALVLFSIIALNWISTESVLAALHLPPGLTLVIMSVNGLCVVLLFLAYLVTGWTYRGEDEHRAERADLVEAARGV